MPLPRAAPCYVLSLLGSAPYHVVQFLICLYSPVIDGPGAFDDEDRRRPIRKDRDDKVHDSIIEERIQRERPCRTLFIRNIKASSNF